MTISILAVTTVAHDLTRFAIEQTLKHIDVDRIVILSDRNFYSEGEFHLIEPITNRKQYSRIMLKDVYQYIETDHVLVVQYDGMAIDRNKWTDDFLGYDYIGAPWPWHNENNVGNGGFSLRSRRLIELVSRDDFEFNEDLNEDENIARYNRSQLESYGIRFADVGTAARFSHEREAGRKDSFGFHGLFNIPFYLDWQSTRLYIEKIPDRLGTDKMELIPYCYAAGYPDLADLGIVLAREAHADFDEKFVAYLSSIPGRFDFFLQS